MQAHVGLFHPEPSPAEDEAQLQLLFGIGSDPVQRIQHAKTTAELAGNARHIQPPARPPPAAAAFNEALEIGGLPPADHAPATRIEDVLYHQPVACTIDNLEELGMIVNATERELFRLLLGLKAEKMRTRAEEITLPPTPELLARFPRLFREEFEAGSMTKEGGVWLERFGTQNPWAWQVVKGIGWIFNTIRHAFNSPHYQELRETAPFEIKDPRAIEALDKEVKEWERTGRIKRVTHYLLDPEKAARDKIRILRILPIFVIEQNGKWRPVYDGRELNCDILNETFKLETVASTARILRPGDFMFTIDMWAGYAQVELQEDLKGYCCFRWREEVYRFEVLPFGLNVAPRIYQKIMSTVFSEWTARGDRCISYIDDGLWAVQGKENALRLRDRVLGDLQALGFQINRQKAHLEPAQAVTFLGYVFDTSQDQVRLFVPEKKIDKLMGVVDEAMTRVTRGEKLRGAEVARIVGQVLAMRHAYSPARLVTRELLALIRQLPLREVRGNDGNWHRARDYSNWVSASAGAVFELRFIRRMRDWNGSEWKPATPTRTLYTDASSWGYGALLHRVADSGGDELLAWRQGEHLLSVSTRDSVRTEQHGLMRALAEVPGLEGHVVLHRTDSMATFRGLVNGGYSVGEASDLNLNAKKIWMIAMLRRVRLVGEFVGADLIIRSGADALSRSDLDDRLTLLDDVFEGVCAAFKCRPEVDLFADPGTVRGKLPFYSRHPLLNVEGIEGYRGHDALTWPWEGECYAFPPLHLVPLVLEKAVREVARNASTRIIVVVPWWPMRSWTALLGPYKYAELGLAEECTGLPPGAVKPIESPATWSSLALRAYLITK